MSPLTLLEIICVQEEGREKFDQLQNAAQGWGVKRLRFCSSDGLGMMAIRTFGSDQVIMLVGKFAFLWIESGKREDYVHLILASGVSQDQIVLLEGSETPQQIEDLVRERISKILKANSA